MLQYSRSRAVLLAGLMFHLGMTSVLDAKNPVTQPAVRRAAWEKDQSVRYAITTEEERESKAAGLDAAGELSLKRTIDVSLKVLSEDPGGGRTIQGTLTQIRLSGRMDGRDVQFDSEHDKAGQGNSVADLLLKIIGAKFQVRVAPDGRIEQVRGLDSAWGGKGFSAPPPPLLSVQFIFRDQAMCRLLSETLSPPLPEPMKEDTRFAERMPLEIPFVTMLEWPATFTVAKPEQAEGVPCAHITGKGTLETARPPADVGTAGLRTTVLEGHRESDLYVAADSGQVVRHTITHDVLVEVVLKPPAGGDTQTMKIRQKIKISATRLK